MLLIVVGILIGVIFTCIRSYISAKIKDTVREKFNGKKFRAGMFRIFDPICWIKDIVSLFNIRKLGIYLLIITVIYGVGKYQGRLGKPIQVDLNYEKEFTLQLNGTSLHKPKNSNKLELLDEKGNKIKDIKVGDVKELKRKLSPFGLQLKPIFVAGGGIGTEGFSGEFGAGISWLRYFQWRIDNFLTNKGIYLGTSYKLKSLDNSAVGVAIGKDYKRADNRFLIYWRWRF
jgi:hypothetical protein